MCRYALTNYKPHYACFRCRKSFKRRLKTDVDPAGPERPARCPDCRGPVADMGLDFAAPKKRDAKGWALLEKIHDVGITFHSCGCNGPGYRPKRAREKREFLQRMLAEYERTLRYWTGYVPPNVKAKQRRTDAIVYWRSRVRALDDASR